MLTAAQRAAVQFFSVPQDDRGETKEQFATTLGITTRTLDRWKADNAEFKQALEKAKKAYESSPDYYALCVRRRALALINEGLAMPLGNGNGKLTSSERRQYIDAALKETKQVSDTMDTIDRSHLSDHELVAEFIDRNLAENLPALIEACDLLTGGRSCTNSPRSSSVSVPEAPAPTPDSEPPEPRKPRAKRGRTTGGGHPGLKKPPSISTPD